MSRLGKLPVEIKKDAKIQVNGQEITVTGPKGSMQMKVPEEIAITTEDNHVTLKIVTNSKRAKSMWGTTRSILQNMVIGTTEGFTKVLEINGVGYRAQVQGKELKMNLGFSHEVVMKIPEGIEVKVEKQTTLIISGYNKQQIGQFAAEIRKLRKPEPYKGKGIKYKGENIRRKEGKKK